MSERKVTLVMTVNTFASKNAIKTGSSLKSRLINDFKKHIIKSKNDNQYDVKVMLFGAAGLDLFGNCMDSYNFKRNKNIPTEKRNYTSTYKATNGIVSSALQVSSGLLILNTKTQDFLAKNLFKGINSKSAEYSRLTKGLRGFSTILISTVLVKRLIAPLIVTPITGIINKKNNKQTVDIFSNHNVNVDNTKYLLKNSYKKINNSQKNFTYIV